ncbi:YbcC family protein [Crateriforma conspicua]|uniref:YbcC family protein n=1 Tax=Crateriforma conspicua TaxID=2527996 RepID=UPI001188D35B|nr:DUF2309 domain-containing protein [Crateriforma conspicua]QDV64207.1 hypothetical protein Mal65_33580 [Crateriforma conspicua]
MSQADSAQQSGLSVATEATTRLHPAEQFRDLVQRIFDVIAPVWPLDDYVAVNPYVGISERRFLNARGFLRVFSESETLMPLQYYADLFRDGQVGRQAIADALDELRTDGVEDDAPWAVDELIEKLRSVPPRPADADAADRIDIPLSIPNPDRRVRSMSELLDRQMGTDYERTVIDEIGKHVPAYYDRGTSLWSMPCRNLTLYQSWHSLARIDRTVEVLGVKDFREFVSLLPPSPKAAIVHCLKLLRVPQRWWETYLLCLVFQMPGWYGWVKFQSQQYGHAGEPDELIDLLAIHLAYEAAIADSESYRVSWDNIADDRVGRFAASVHESLEEVKLRYLMLRATELTFQRELLGQLSSTGHPPALVNQNGQTDQTSQHADSDQTNPKPDETPIAQIAFCIDVRSERLRRHLESSNAQVQTLGFAGFFGMPIDYVPLDSEAAKPQVPFLLRPSLRVFEGHRGANADELAWQRHVAIQQRKNQSWLSSLKDTALGGFAFVESLGLSFLPKLFGQTVLPTLQPKQGSQSHAACGTEPVAPMSDLDTACQQAWIDAAEGLIRGLGLVGKPISDLLILCGHESHTTNNPVAATLQCGACGGHSGEVNARVAAALLNRPDVREALSERGVCIPSSTVVLAAVHETTTDHIRLVDADSIPSQLQSQLSQVKDAIKVACKATRRERQITWREPGADGDSLRRSLDWGEVRPEWGLAGNAAIVFGPRERTRSADLNGRVFLHEYDAESDPDGELLNNLVAGPLVVAHSINMQYYASVVDNRHFGSGNKTVHNVVGGFGVQSGNGGDLMNGLAWQSLHNGSRYAHEPLRLLAVFYASRSVVDRVLASHDDVRTWIENRWLNLVAIEGQQSFRLSDNGQWVEVASDVAA